MPRFRRSRRDFDAIEIAAAIAFHITMFLGAGKYDRRRADSLDEARSIKRTMDAEPGNYGRRAAIYAETADGLNIHVE
jgi:hypothetical protein